MTSDHQGRSSFIVLASCFSKDHRNGSKNLSMILETSEHDRSVSSEVLFGESNENSMFLVSLGEKTDDIDETEMTSHHERSESFLVFEKRTGLVIEEVFSDPDIPSATSDHQSGSSFVVLIVELCFARDEHLDDAEMLHVACHHQSSSSHRVL